MQPALGKAPGEREKTQLPADQTGQGLRKSSGVQGGAHQEKGRAFRWSRGLAAAGGPQGSLEQMC